MQDNETFNVTINLIDNVTKKRKTKHHRLLIGDFHLSADVMFDEKNNNEVLDNYQPNISPFSFASDSEEFRDFLKDCIERYYKKNLKDVTIISVSVV